jgi:hypothetical protein
MCLWTTNIKTKMATHLSRKRPCKNINNIDIKDCIDYILNGISYDEYKNIKYDGNLNTTKIPQNTTISQKNTTKIPQNTTISQKNTTKIPQNTTKYPETCKSYECEFCNKKYSRMDSLNRHLKNCKEKEKDDEDRTNLLNLVDMLNNQLKEQRDEFKQQRDEFKKELNKKNEQIDELIKKAGVSIGTQNIQQNIKILAYKNTDLSHLTDQDYLQCLNRSNMVIPSLIKKIHFNPEKPENHNIYISNIKNKYIMKYDGDKWNLGSQNETIDDLIDTNEVVIEQKLEEWLENGKEYPQIMKKFNRYLEKKENDEVKNAIKEEIKLILYNNRNFSNNFID